MESLTYNKASHHLTPILTGLPAPCIHTVQTIRTGLAIFMRKGGDCLNCSWKNDVNLIVPWDFILSAFYSKYSLFTRTEKKQLFLSCQSWKSEWIDLNWQGENLDLNNRL